GGTVEERGFDDRITAGGLLALIEGAWRAMPAIEELPVAETWVGFRPGSRDDAPILGPSGVAGLVLATGHHRHGIRLTPVTAHLRLRVDRPSARGGAAIHTRTLRGSRSPIDCKDRPHGCGSPMMRLRVNGVEEDVAVTTVSELLASRGIHPAARFVAVAINGS